MPPLLTQGFHHVTMVSTNAARTVAFYRDLLGLSLVKRTVNFDDPGSWHLYFGVDGGRPGTLLTFFEWPHAARGQWGVGGVHHVALEVDDLEGLLRWKRRLHDQGVGASGPVDRGYFMALYFRDPDGQILELSTKGPGYALDEAPDALGMREIVPDAGRLPGAEERAGFEAQLHPEPVPEVLPSMRIRGIHHVTGITGTLETVDAFYQEALGLRLVKRTLNQDDGRTRHWFWARWDGDAVGAHSAYTQFGWPGSTLRARGGAGQVHHLAFRAGSDDEQRAWQEHLRRLGVPVSEVRDRQYFRSIYFHAPDGQLLEIATDGPGFAVDEDAGRLGERLCLPEWMEDARPRIEAALSPLEPFAEGARVPGAGGSGFNRKEGHDAGA